MLDDLDALYALLRRDGHTLLVLMMRRSSRGPSM